jgi:hypothetical protein
MWSTGINAEFFTSACRLFDSLKRWDFSHAGYHIQLNSQMQQGPLGLRMQALERDNI